MALIDEILSSYAIEDRVVILDIARRYKLDDDDPSFVLLLATGALERLLEQHPSKLQAIFSELSNAELEVRSQLNRDLVQVLESQRQVKQTIDQSLLNYSQRVSEIADHAVRGAVAKQAGSLAKGIESGVKANLVLHLKKMIPFIVMTVLIVFVFGLVTGLTMHLAMA